MIRGNWVFICEHGSYYFIFLGILTSLAPELWSYFFEWAKCSWLFLSQKHVFKLCNHWYGGYLLSIFWLVAIPENLRKVRQYSLWEQLFIIYLSLSIFKSIIGKWDNYENTLILEYMNSCSALHVFKLPPSCVSQILIY